MGPPPAQFTFRQICIGAAMLPLTAPRPSFAADASTRRSERVSSLDTLRGIAVSAIVVFHCVNNPGVFRLFATTMWLDRLTWSFWIGVDAFFVLSGYLIGTGLMRRRNRPAYYFDFFVRRAGRILPLYFIMVGLFLAFKAAGAAQWSSAFTGLFGLLPIPTLAYLSFTQNFAAAYFGGWGPSWLAVTWSLAIEVHFYLLIPLIIRAVSSRHLALVCLVIIVFSMACSVAMQTFGFAYQALVLTPTRLASPFMGVFCACLAQCDIVRSTIARHQLLSKSVACCLFALMYISVMQVSADESRPISIWVDLFLREISMGLLVLTFALSSQQGSPRLPTRMMRWAGVRCYALYLFHAPLLWIVSHFANRGLPPHLQPGQETVAAVLVPTTIVMTVLFAAASWKWVELPLMQLAARFAVRGTPPEDSRRPVGQTLGQAPAVVNQH